MNFVSDFKREHQKIERLPTFVLGAEYRVQILFDYHRALAYFLGHRVNQFAGYFRGNEFHQSWFHHGVNHDFEHIRVDLNGRLQLFGKILERAADVLQNLLVFVGLRFQRVIMPEGEHDLNHAHLECAERLGSYLTRAFGTLVKLAEALTANVLRVAAVAKARNQVKPEFVAEVAPIREAREANAGVQFFAGQALEGDLGVTATRLLPVS